MKNKKASILIVDDDESICRTMGLILENEGYRTDSAFSGTEALEKLGKTFYNAALLDIRLPDVEGPKLLKKFNARSPQTITIMVTGYPQLENAIEALNEGADAYFVKPVNPDELINVLKKKLEQQKEDENTTEESITRFLEARTKLLLQESE